MANYILDADGDPRLCLNLKEFNIWFEKPANRFLLQTDIKDILVSTVFLGIDHAPSYARTPILWETMVFRGKKSLDDYTNRYTTKDDAIKGHMKACKKIKRDLKKGLTLV